MTMSVRSVALLAACLQLVRSTEGTARRTTFYEDYKCGVEIFREYVYSARAIGSDGTTSEGQTYEG